jgi:hypothetical protein
MYRQIQPNQIFTVFGSYVLEDDYYRGGNARTSDQVRCDARKVELADTLRQATRQ